MAQGDGQNKVRKASLKQNLFKYKWLTLCTLFPSAIQSSTTIHTKKERGPSSLHQAQRLDGKLHCIYPLEDAGFKKGYTKDCIVCSDRNSTGGRKRTTFYCKTCATKPGLHAGLCFEIYHNVKEFKLFWNLSLSKKIQVSFELSSFVKFNKAIIFMSPFKW